MFIQEKIRPRRRVTAAHECEDSTAEDRDERETDEGKNFVYIFVYCFLDIFDSLS